MMFDGGTWIDVALPEVATDPLKFRDEKRYVDRLKDARSKTGLQDAFKIGFGRVGGIPMTLAVQEFGFMAGSLGMAAGEPSSAAPRKAVEKKTPYILFSASAARGCRRNPLADADAAHDRGSAAPARRAPALHRRADEPDHGRRHRLLRHAG